MKSYIFPIVVEPDEDKWRAYVPDLENRGAVTWGNTRDEAIRNIQEVAQMVVEELIEGRRTASHKHSGIATACYCC